MHLAEVARICREEISAICFRSCVVPNCVETMGTLENKTATFTPQDNEASTHTKMISKELEISPRKYQSCVAFNEDFLRRLDAYEVDLVVRSTDISTCRYTYRTSSICGT